MLHIMSLMAIQPGRLTYKKAQKHICAGNRMKEKVPSGIPLFISISVLWKVGFFYEKADI